MHRGEFEEDQEKIIEILKEGHTSSKKIEMGDSNETVVQPNNDYISIAGCKTFYTT